MSAKMLLTIGLFLSSVSAASVSSLTSLQAMEQAFARSDEAHAESMDKIMKGMTQEKAWQVLEKSNVTNIGLLQRNIEYINAVGQQKKRSFLHATPQATATKRSNKPTTMRGIPSGYTGIDGARKMLNDMIFQAAEKYDEEVQDCSDDYAQFCGDMEDLRSEMTAANFLCARTRETILDAQSRIERNQKDIPITEERLKHHNIMSQHEISAMTAREKLLQGDIQILEGILNMTSCKHSLVQVIQLENLTPETRNLMTDTVRSIVGPGTSGQKALLQRTSSKIHVLQVGDLVVAKWPGFRGKSDNPWFAGTVEAISDDLDHCTIQYEDGDHSTDVKQDEVFYAPLRDPNWGKNELRGNDLKPIGALPVTLFSVKFPKAGRVEVPTDPCTIEGGGAPTYRHKEQASCKLPPGPQCQDIQEKFLGIQADILDEQADLLEAISNYETWSHNVKTTFEAQIKHDEDLLADAQTALSSGMATESTCEDTAHNALRKHDLMEKELNSKMKSCSSNYVNFETELCALKKIRGELYKMKGKSASFQDCVVGKWVPQDCSVKCGGGVMTISRDVEMPRGTGAEQGADCLPQKQERTCNVKGCPKDCKVSAYGGWSKCTADCDGGVMQRIRLVETPAKNGGVACPETVEEKRCNTQACEKDCELTEWTKWSSCSKDCDGGTRKRMKFVKSKPEGTGKCADAWSTQRLQYEECNKHECPSKMTCKKKLDIVLLLDGSGSLRQSGFDAEKEMAEQFVDAFDVAGHEAKISVIRFSGPSTYWRTRWCFSDWGKKIFNAEWCGIKTAISMENAASSGNMKAVKDAIKGLKFKGGGTLTSLALYRAAKELTLGRKDAESVVVVVTDGKPFSHRKTLKAAEFVRETSRLVFVPVIDKAPLKEFKQYATRRTQENIIPVDNIKGLTSPVVVNHILADICPQE